MASNEYGRKSGLVGFVAQFYVFKGRHYIGWDCFTTEEVSAGSGKNADLVLDDQNISEIQALFCFRGNSITVSDVTKEGGVFVNSESVKTRELKPLDVVSIGTYSIKVKVKWQKMESRITDRLAPSDDEYKKIQKKSSEDNGVKQDIQEDKNVLLEKSVEENEAEAVEDINMMKVTRIFSDKEGVSHFDEIEISVNDAGQIGRLSEKIPATGIIFRENPPDYKYDWHTAPQRQYIIILDGEIEAEVGDGKKRLFRAGDVLLVEDVTGTGHRAQSTTNRPYMCIFVTID